MSDPDTQQGRPPPPPPPSGSPFGRFLTSPVLLVSVIALVVGVATFASLGGGGGTSGGGEPGDSQPAIAGSWESLPTSTGKQPVVQLEVAPSGGTLESSGESTSPPTPSASASGTGSSSFFLRVRVRLGFSCGCACSSS